MPLYKRKILSSVNFQSFRDSKHVSENEHPDPKCGWEACTVNVVYEKRYIYQNPALLRAIAETGPSTRNKAIELGILPSNLVIPPTEWVDKAQGVGSKDFSFLSKHTLHEKYNAMYIRWAIKENGVIILSSATFSEKDVDKRLLITENKSELNTATYWE